MLDPCPLNPRVKVIDDLPLEGSGNLAPQEGSHLRRLHRLDRSTGDRLIEGLKIGLPEVSAIFWAWAKSGGILGEV